MRSVPSIKTEQKSQNQKIKPKKQKPKQFIKGEGNLGKIVDQMHKNQSL
jgi:hypothetical protein